MISNGPYLYMSRRRLASISVPLLILIVLGLGLGFHQQIKNQLNAWKLLPQPERLTELYFTNPNSLPSAYTPGQTQTVQFTTHNLEYQTETYQYKILEQNQDGTKSQQLAAGQFTLQQNQYKRMDFPIIPIDFGPKVQISVVLPTVNETISYWTGGTR